MTFPPIILSNRFFAFTLPLLPKDLLLLAMHPLCALVESESKELSRNPIFAIHTLFSRLEAQHQKSQRTIEKYQIGNMNMTPGKKEKQKQQKKMKNLRVSSERREILQFLKKYASFCDTARDTLAGQRDLTCFITYL